MKPTKAGQTVLFRAGRLREYPAITRQAKGVMTVTDVMNYPKGYCRGVITVIDEAGNTHVFHDYWLKTTRTKPGAKNK